MGVTKYSLIGALLSYHPETVEVFEEIGLQCVKCPSSARETVEQACNVHGIDVDELIEKQWNTYQEYKRKYLKKNKLKINL